MDKVWSVILAAGASIRMKKQKMLLPFNGKTIIETVVENALPVSNSNVLVVLGSHSEQIKAQIRKLPVTVCMNENFMEGMLSSVICGLQNLPGDARAVMIFLGDQPQIPASAAVKVKETWLATKKGIVIPTYNGKRGHPVIIDMKYKEEIENLDPQKGLRELMKRNGADILEVDCGMAEILRDIDTPGDYENEIKTKIS